MNSNNDNNLAIIDGNNVKKKHYTTNKSRIYIHASANGTIRSAEMLIACVELEGVLVVGNIICGVRPVVYAESRMECNLRSSQQAALPRRGDWSKMTDKEKAQCKTFFDEKEVTVARSVVMAQDQPTNDHPDHAQGWRVRTFDQASDRWFHCGNALLGDGNPSPTFKGYEHDYIRVLPISARFPGEEKVLQVNIRKEVQGFRILRVSWDTAVEDSSRLELFQIPDVDRQAPQEVEWEVLFRSVYESPLGATHGFGPETEADGVRASEWLAALGKDAGNELLVYSTLKWGDSPHVGTYRFQWLSAIMEGDIPTRSGGRPIKTDTAIAEAFDMLLWNDRHSDGIKLPVHDNQPYRVLKDLENQGNWNKAFAALPTIVGANTAA